MTCRSSRRRRSPCSASSFLQEHLARARGWVAQRLSINLLRDRSAALLTRSLLAYPSDMSRRSLARALHLPARDDFFTTSQQFCGSLLQRRSLEERRPTTAAVRTRPYSICTSPCTDPAPTSLSAIAIPRRRLAAANAPRRAVVAENAAAPSMLRRDAGGQRYGLQHLAAAHILDKGGEPEPGRIPVGGERQRLAQRLGGLPMPQWQRW
jgi:hypothetical protein